MKLLLIYIKYSLIRLWYSNTGCLKKNQTSLLTLKKDKKRLLLKTDYCQNPELNIVEQETDQGNVMDPRGKGRVEK